MKLAEKELLKIRNLEASDLDQLWNLVERDLTNVPLSWPKNSKHFEEWLLNGILDELPTKYIIEYDDKGITKIAGIISIDIINNENQINYQMASTGDANVSYMTFPDFAGLGVATFAVNEISKILISNKLKPILRIAIWNKASARVAIKCGFIKHDSGVIIQDYFDEEPTILDVYRKIII
jgi:RimJ/RimL family protein N-acetyltransferase